jgi:hypothetical protein
MSPGRADGAVVVSRCAIDAARDLAAAPTVEASGKAAVAMWLDDRLVDFANPYQRLHFTSQYLCRELVSDMVVGIRLPGSCPTTAGRPRTSSASRHVGSSRSDSD